MSIPKACHLVKTTDVSKTELEMQHTRQPAARLVDDCSHTWNRTNAVRFDICQARVHDVAVGVQAHASIQIIFLGLKHGGQICVGDLGRYLALHQRHAVILFYVALPLQSSAMHKSEFKQSGSLNLIGLRMRSLGNLAGALALCSQDGASHL